MLRMDFAAFERSAVFLYHPSRENLVMGPNIPDGTPFSRLFAHFNRVLLRQNTSKFLVSCSSLLMRLVAIISGFEAAGNLCKDTLQYSRSISTWDTSDSRCLCEVL
ncbi:uncharacterized protein EURHEDRAFT_171382 [Aspergillus ruber CBS 135680]|uniref:Uncharacterized protein n=1 Tax=Aspergillus ruber (strain CBS 135680) TaxID=1388766 RepID=A0A017S7B0_ASPRC|nr:uncharacterized protein EURHEDRAFT_171382 [Aspergillus ruber CBS 135680]EYE92928.1 hypothetical protein EURHEDRAFT_171382 [Aspergillus ruber CBS 135680]